MNSNTLIDNSVDCNIVVNNSVNGKSVNNMANNVTLPNNNGNYDNMFNNYVRDIAVNDDNKFNNCMQDNGVNDDQLVNDYGMNSTRAHEPNEITRPTPRKRKTISFSPKDNSNYLPVPFPRSKGSYRVQRGIPRGLCYGCRDKGHYQNTCPFRNVSNTSGNDQLCQLGRSNIM